ncbi:Kinesin-like protein kif22 [Branchiostoma belcheri]|nr:Kinesin-like protein kif22 [Branchiostoma belcheri]
MMQILLAYGIPTETVDAIMMLYRDTQVIVRSPDGDTEPFNIVAGVLQGDTLAPYLFVMCLDYVLRTSVDQIQENGFILEHTRSRRYPARHLTDADFADDLALFSNTIQQAEGVGIPKVGPGSTKKPGEVLDEALPVYGPPPKIDKSRTSKAINAMKRGKAAGPSGIVAEMLQAGGEFMADQIASLTNAIIKEERIPNDWNLSYIINCYKGKGDPLERGNYRGLKLLDQVLKVVERVLEPMIREQVHIDSMQFGFTPGRGTTDAIFILRQLQEKFLSKRKDLYFMFVDLEKAFDRVPREVLWWAMRKLGVQEWLVRVVQSMYCHARSRVRINGSYSSEFDVRVGVHQGSVLSPLLFIIVMEALSRGFRTGCPWEMLYADDLGLAAETLMLLAERFCPWQNNLSSHGLRTSLVWARAKDGPAELAKEGHDNARRGTKPAWSSKKRWIDSIREDVKNLKLQKADPLDRSSWRTAIRPKRHPTTSNPCMTGINGR